MRCGPFSPIQALFNEKTDDHRRRSYRKKKSFRRIEAAIKLAEELSGKGRPPWMQMAFEQSAVEGAGGEEIPGEAGPPRTSTSLSLMDGCPDFRYWGVHAEAVEDRDNFPRNQERQVPYPGGVH